MQLLFYRAVLQERERECRQLLVLCSCCILYKRVIHYSVVVAYSQETSVNKMGVVDVDATSTAVCDFQNLISHQRG